MHMDASNISFIPIVFKLPFPFSFACMQQKQEPSLSYVRLDVKAVAVK